MQEPPIIFPVNLITHNPNFFDIPAFVTFSWVATLIIIVVALLAKKSLNLVPRGAQNFVEVIMEFFLDLAESNIGHMGRHFFPFLATLGIYILVCNFLGLIPGCEAPTSNLNTNAALALPVFFATHIYGIKAHGLGYIKHFVGPMRSLPALPLMILMFIRSSDWSFAVTTPVNSNARKQSSTGPDLTHVLHHSTIEVPPSR